MSEPTAAVHADAIAVLAAWDAPDAGQAAIREAVLAYLARVPDACARSCVSGHLTASALVVDDAGEHALLTLHPAWGAGYSSAGTSRARTGRSGAALREATEESGIEGLAISSAPIHLDVHPITCSLGVPTRHLDVRYLVRAPAGARAVVSEESVDLRWWPLAELPDDVAFGRSLLIG